jgi:hypothetical protein
MNEPCAWPLSEKNAQRFEHPECEFREPHTVHVPCRKKAPQYCFLDCCHPYTPPMEERDA